MADAILSPRAPASNVAWTTSLCLGGLPALAAAQDAVTAGAIAAPAPQVAASGSFLWDLVAVLVPLLLVIAGLCAVLYFARRRYKLTGRDAALSIVQVLPVGPRDRVVVLRTRANRVLAIGVGPQSLNLIAELTIADIGLDAEPPTEPADRNTLPSTDSTGALRSGEALLGGKRRM